MLKFNCWWMLALTGAAAGSEASVNCSKYDVKFCPIISLILLFQGRGTKLASWLVYWPPDLAVRVQVLARDIVLCLCARHFTLTVSLSTQVYKWVPVNLMLG